MTENEEQQLNKSLKSWEVTPKPDPDFKHNVHHRIHEQFFAREHASEQSAREWFKQLLYHPIFASVALFTIVGLTALTTVYFHSHHTNRTNDSSLPESYQAVIDPEQTARLMLAASTGFKSLASEPSLSRKSFEEAMVWIVNQMDLKNGQALAFQQIHERFFTRYELLCGQLIQLENEYRQFERDRIAGKNIDLFSVYANFQHQKSIYQQTIQLQQELIHEVSDLLTPQQQGAYGQLFHSNPSPKQDSPSAKLDYPTREWQI